MGARKLECILGFCFYMGAVHEHFLSVAVFLGFLISLHFQISHFPPPQQPPCQSL